MKASEFKKIHGIDSFDIIKKVSPELSLKAVWSFEASDDVKSFCVFIEDDGFATIYRQSDVAADDTLRAEKIKREEKFAAESVKFDTKQKAQNFADNQKQQEIKAAAIEWITEQESAGLVCKLPEFGDMPSRLDPVIGADNFAVVYKKDSGSAIFARNEEGNLYSSVGGIMLVAKVKNCPAEIESEVKRQLIARTK
jgi:hypothetical protein